MRITYAFILAFLSLLLAGCDDRRTVGGEEPDAAGAYLKLTVAVAPQSRSNPSPGEEGDGREDGVRKENDIEDITLFIYNDPGDGLDSDAATPLLFSCHASAADLKREADGVSCVLQLSGYTPGAAHRVIAVVNAGDIRDEVRTLGELRVRLATGAWREGKTPGACYRFMMASAFNGAKRTDDDGKIIRLRDGASDRDNPAFAARVSVERVAARIDLMFADSSDLGIEYVVNSTTGATLSLTHALPVNRMLAPSYTLKHVSEGMDTSALLVCGDETTSGGVATNYVIEPSTLLKTGDVTDAMLDSWYGDSRASRLRGNTGAFGSSAQIASLLSESMAITAPDGPETRFLTLAYANENTVTDAQAGDWRFVTGLAFRAVYRPARIYADASCSASVAPERGGSTFWLVRPTRQEMREEDCLYFTTETAARAYADAHPELLATVTGYEGGVCYYNLWIRHAGELPGIVRNNIYCVGLSFTGPGEPLPEITIPKYVESRIFVRKWNFRPQGEILM